MKALRMGAALTAAAFAAPAPLASALLCTPLIGCVCSVSAAPIDFGPIQPLSGSSASAVGEVTISCTGVLDVAPNVVVKLGAGQSGAISNRTLRASGGDAMAYNLYTTAAHAIIWGDGATGASVTVSGGILSLGSWQASRAVYGLATYAPATKPGVYSDSVVVRIDW
ncbi:MAG: spore coat U domain-containing protein [Hyphomonadaceae bacterium]